MRTALLALTLAGCGGDPFSLETVLPETPLHAETQEAASFTPEAPYDVRGLPDAGGWDGDSGSDSEVGIDRVVVDSAIETTLEQFSEAMPTSPEASSQGCPPPVAGGYSNVCATAPTRGQTIISTFPGECACNWTCACLMTSTICESLGRPQSCMIVNGSVCNSVVVAVVTCQ